MSRVKICGITRPQDAQVADQAGAHAVGLIFAPSPRRISVETAVEIDRALTPWITRVGVFVDASLQEIDAALRRVRLDVLQLHGNESPQLVREVREAFGRRIVKGVRVRDEQALHSLTEYDVDAFLLDTYVPGRPGGTGETFDWHLAIPWARRFPLILAGGLNPDNVAEAVRLVQPYGVDVSSGVESQPGVKDHQKVREFTAQVRKLEET